MPTSTIGQLCTSDESVARFLKRVFDQTSGSLQLPRQNELWDVIESAHTAGFLGRGRRVGVLDTGFDLGIERLRHGEWADPSSPPSPARGHGFAVTLLINEVAPEANLVIHDIRPGRFLHAANVAAGIDLMVRSEVDVVNLSLGFVTDARPVVGGIIDTGGLIDLDADPATYHHMLDRYRDEGGFFAPGGCVRPCPICSRLTALSGGPAIIAAAGNTNHTYCPSAHDICTGAGFHAAGTVVVNGNLVNLSRLPTSERPLNDQSVVCEFTVPLPECFEETSFAAPLLAGVAALDPSVGDLHRVLAVGRAVEAVVSRHNALESQAATGSVTLEQGHKVRDAYLHALHGLPPAHHHWQRHDPPCPSCGLAVAKAYKGIIQTSFGVGQFDQARRWADAALRVCPLSFDLLLDKAALLRSTVAAGRSNAPGADISEAIGTYEQALDRRTSHPDLVGFCQQQMVLTAQLPH